MKWDIADRGGRMYGWAGKRAYEGAPPGERPDPAPDVPFNYEHEIASGQARALHRDSGRRVSRHSSIDRLLAAGSDETARRRLLSHAVIVAGVSARLRAAAVGVEEKAFLISAGWNPFNSPVNLCVGAWHCRSPP